MLPGPTSGGSKPESCKTGNPGRKTGDSACVSAGKPCSQLSPDSLGISSSTELAKDYFALACLAQFAVARDGAVQRRNNRLDEARVPRISCEVEAARLPRHISPSEDVPPTSRPRPMHTKFTLESSPIDLQTERSGLGPCHATAPARSWRHLTRRRGGRKKPLRHPTARRRLRSLRPPSGVTLNARRRGDPASTHSSRPLASQTGGTCARGGDRCLRSLAAPNVQRNGSLVLAAGDGDVRRSQPFISLAAP